MGLALRPWCMLTGLMPRQIARSSSCSSSRSSSTASSSTIKCLFQPPLAGPSQHRSITASSESRPRIPDCSMTPPALRMPSRSQSHVTQARGKTDLVRSIRAMPIKLVRCSKDNSKAAQDMAQEWLTKLSRYTAVSEVVIKPNPKGAASPQVQKAAEAEKVLKAIAPGERVVLLDERGRDASSEDMVRLLIKASDDGAPLCFVIGGPFGHGPAVLERGDESVRLSKMVLNHSVAYIVLVEQLYRAWTIVRGEPYHH